MRTGLLALLSLPCLCISLYGQGGTVSFANNSSTAVTDMHTGQRVPSGSVFKATLYVAPDGTTDDSQFVAVPGDATFVLPGIFNGGSRTIYGYPPGSYVMLQVRVWETAYGSNYESAAAAPPMNGRTALIGKSVRMRARLADYSSIPPEQPTKLIDIGLQAFSVSAIPVPSLSINEIVVSEGTNGFKDAVFTVTLDPPSDVDVSVDYATADGTALAGSDYIATNGTLTFLAGETSKSVRVTITGDLPPESDETFYVNLSNAGGVPFVQPQGACVITEVRVTGISIDVAVSFNTVPARQYVLEFSDDGLNWSTVPGADNIQGTGDIVTAFDRAAGCQNQRLYRARLHD